MDDAQVPAARPVSSGCLRGRHSRSLALAVPLRVVYCRNNERVISVVLVFLSLCLSVLGFRFLLLAKRHMLYVMVLCNCSHNVIIMSPSSEPVILRMPH